MDPKVQFVFFVAATVCFFWEAFVDYEKPKRVLLVPLGWLLFCIPFAYNAAVSGW